MTKRQIKAILNTLMADNDKVTFSINGVETIKVPITMTNKEIAEVLKKDLTNSHK